MDNKGRGIISYIFGWLGGLIVLCAFKDNDKKTTIHACQAIIANVAYILINMIYRFIPITIPLFSLVIFGLYVAIVVMGIVKVCNNEEAELPVIGNLAKSIFANKINSAPDVVNTNTTETPKEEPKAEEPKQEEAKPEEPKNE